MTGSSRYYHFKTVARNCSCVFLGIRNRSQLEKMQPVIKTVSENDQEIPQSHLWHHEEEQHNYHETP